MNERFLARMDRLSAIVLLLWAGLAVGLSAVAVSTAFRHLPAQEAAGQVEVCRRWIDRLAWGAFGLAFLASHGGRWFLEMKEEGVGPLRLWSAAALAALLMCFTSSAIVGPRMAAIRAETHGMVLGLPQDGPEQRAYRRARNIVCQLIGLRVLLALGLAAGLARLPKRGGADNGIEAGR